MKLIIITGPHAVGKMTVGQQLAKKTGMKLFHNHMTIDVVADMFQKDRKEQGRLTEMFREEIFRSFAKSNEKGMIFTFMWAFDTQGDWDYIHHVEEIFKEQGAEVYYVELEADFDVRIERNKTENRLLYKSTKRDVVKSEQLFRMLEGKYRLNSLPGEINKPNYIKINNTFMEPTDVAELIIEHFDLESNREKLSIVHLPKEQWTGEPIPMPDYTTNVIYDVELLRDPDGYRMNLKKKTIDEPITHTPEEYDFPDKLYPEYYEHAWAWGIVKDGKLLATIETDQELWSNRLRVAELWVSEELRGQGYGHRLMNIAKEQARLERRRAIILETQSCNANAIDFYRHEGFDLIGFDSCCYSNRDIERREMRVEMGWFPPKKDKSLAEKVIIRPETKEDWHQTEEMTQRAFWNKYQQGCDEHYLVRKLRGEEAYLPEFSRVAELNGRIVGAVYYTKSTVTEENGMVHPVVTFGPLCVDPDYQGCRIGERLLQETLPLVKEAGYPCVVIFGEPDYYPRVGFENCKKYGIYFGEGKNSPSFHCYVLDKKKMAAVKGKFEEAELFEDLPKEEVEAMNKEFPYLTKLHFPCQW